MSTKADIIIDGEKQHYIYVRHDGSPKYVIPFIMPLIKDYFKSNKQQSLLEFLSKKLNISLTDENYSKDGFGLHTFATDGRDPWREFEYVVRKNGDITVFGHIEGEYIETYHMEEYV